MPVERSSKRFFFFPFFSGTAKEACVVRRLARLACNESKKQWRLVESTYGKSKDGDGIIIYDRGYMGTPLAKTCNCMKS